MLDLESPSSRQNFKTRLAERATSDAAFRETLLSNSRAIVAQELGPEMASHLEVIGHPETSNSITYIINYNPNPAQPGSPVKIEPQDTVQDVLSKKAQHDPKYRHEFLANPRGVLKKELGVDLPGNYDVNVFEESRDQLHLNVPAFENADGELSEEDLDNVGGGTFMEWLNRICTGPWPGQSSDGRTVSGVRG